MYKLFLPKGSSSKTFHVFESSEEAVHKAKQYITQYLKSLYSPGMSAEDLWTTYEYFGDEPVIVSKYHPCQFNFLSFVKEKSNQIIDEKKGNSLL